MKTISILQGHGFNLPALERWAASGLILLSMAALAIHIAYLSVPLVDDAAISISYALTFFGGHGLRLTPNSQMVEAYSNPLWTLLVGLSIPLHLDPVRFTQLLGISCALLSIPAFACWGPAAEGRRLQTQDAAIGVAALVPAFVYWSASGMETGLHVLLLGASGALVLLEQRRGSGSLCGLALGLLTLTRPEGLLYTIAAALVWLVIRASEHRAPGRQELSIALWLIAVVGGYLLLRWLYFASLLPNTYFAKQFWDFRTGEYIGGFVSLYKWLCAAGLAGVALSWVGGRRIVSAALLGLAFTGSGVLFAWQVKGDWMREWRFLAPIVPCLATMFALGLSGLRRAIERWMGPRLDRFSWFAPGATLLIASAIGAAEAWVGQRHSPELKAGPEMSCAYITGVVNRVSRELEPFGQLRPLVGLPDLGGLGLTLRNAEVIDVGGLADYAVAHHANNYPAIEDYLVSEGLPSIIDAHGPSGHLASFSKLMSNYAPPSSPELRAMGSFAVVKGLSATDDPRCPGGKQSILSIRPDQLADRLRSELESAHPLEALKIWRCVYSYQNDGKLLPLDERRRLARVADALSVRAEAAGNTEAALRFLSFAAVIEGGNAHYRRRAELLRQRLFPRPR